VQIGVGSTIAPGETQWAILYWLAAACCFGLGRLVEDRERFLSGLLWFGALMSILSLAELDTSKGKILWVIPIDSEDRVFGTFPYHNNYAAFMELLLPLALWRTLKNRRHWWVYAGVAALMYASVIACASRAGAVLATLELAAVLLFAAWRNTGQWRLAWRMAAILGGAMAFTLVAGYETVWQRFWAPDPYSMRREFHESALAMARARPVTGFGLGTWTSAYPAFAIADFGVIANHAHSEWGQWAAEGGWGVAAMMAALFGLSLRKSMHVIWALGLVAVLLHGMVDYPLVRLGLGSWWFVMLGLVSAERRTSLSTG
jgi:O-antigen ligase